MEQYAFFFDTAYKTGSDIWSQAPTGKELATLFAELPEGAMVLDIGAGRGRAAFRLVEDYDCKVIGMDIAPSIVEKNNEEAKHRGFEHSIRFIEGDVSDIPFTDHSFDAVLDIGLLQHMPEEQWQTYFNEVSRVTKENGYLINVSLSKKTPSFLGFKPREADERATHESEGIIYHFFNPARLNAIFQSRFEVVNQFEKIYPDFESIAYIFTLFQKSKDRQRPADLI